MLMVGKETSELYLHLTPKGLLLEDHHELQDRYHKRWALHIRL